jgi:hypothetical protein
VGVRTVACPQDGGPPRDRGGGGAAPSARRNIDLSLTEIIADQARLLAVQFHRLVLKVSESGIPLVFPVFPRIATDWKYLHKCLQPVLPPEITEDQARDAHARIADKTKVRVKGEIFHEASSNVIYRKELGSEPRYPRSTTSRSGAKSPGCDGIFLLINVTPKRRSWSRPSVNWSGSASEPFAKPRSNASVAGSRDDRSPTE